MIAGIGNAYSDEILHTARLSPFKLAAKLTDDEMRRLHEAMRSVLTDAVARSVGQKAATLKWEKRSGLQVHARDRPAVPGLRRHGRARCPSPTARSSTARPARPKAASSPTAGCPG